MVDFDNLLKILAAYELKTVARNSSNYYFDSKEKIEYKRKETVAEHVYSSLKLADLFLREPEFAGIDHLQVHDLLLYHDDVEIVTGDVCISNRDARKTKEQDELEALPILAGRYPRGLDERLLAADAEFRAQVTPAARFANAVDKFDVIVHELKYPQDWGPKGFDEEHVRAWFQPAFDYSPTFTEYFEKTVEFLKEKKHF